MRFYAFYLERKPALLGCDLNGERVKVSTTFSTYNEVIIYER
jgi:hypothetical protein